MEELINKNIFDDRDLVKHSPDFKPKQALLRMQMRSTMVKDTHSHPKFKSDSWQRKTIKRPKDSFKIGKEIAKIRNGFQYINLKNQIMLKNAVKYVDKFKSEYFMNGCNEELNNTLMPEQETYLQDISDMNLTLRNDTEFKLTEKPYKVPKLNTKLRDHRKKIKNTNDIKNEVEYDEDTYFKDMLKIECTMIKPAISSEALMEDSEKNDTSTTDNNVKEPDITLDLKSSTKTQDKDVNDLQTLLIMLAISPQQNELINEPENPVSNLKNEQCDVIECSQNDKVEESQDETSQKIEIYNFLNIVPMRVEINERQKAIMKKYMDKWRAYVDRKKKLAIQQKREETLNAFFDKISKKKMSVGNTPETPVNKAKLLARDYTKYRHRYQVQKHIIALQKAKLEEQSRIIEELKYNRIIEASKISVEAMKEEVRKTYNEIDKQLKPKLKCLTNELKIEIEEPSLVLHCLKVPQFIQRMEKRAREREEKHAMIRERRKQMEEERIRLKQQEELAKAQMDKDEKIKRMNELKDKRKKEKIENIRKKQHAERMRALNVMAELHYEKNLKVKYGIRPFRILIEIKKDNIEKAKAHYKFQLKKNIFLNWMWYTEDLWYERNFKAQDFYRKKTLKIVFDAFKKNHHSLVLKKQVAEDYYDLFVTNLVFRKFRLGIEIIKKENETKFQMAVLYHNSNLLFRAFCCWRTLPALSALRREQEARKARWREKVLQVVPDYIPPDD